MAGGTAGQKQPGGSPEEILQEYLRYLRGETTLNVRAVDTLLGQVSALAEQGQWGALIKSLSTKDRDTLFKTHPQLSEAYGTGELNQPLGGTEADALAELNRIFGGASSISRDITRTTTTDITETGVSNVARQTRRYIDVPTPEEFLNQFQNAFATHLKNITGMQGVSRLAAQFAIDNMEMFLTDYLGTLGQAAARGEDIFSVVGATGEPQFLGARPGAQITERTTGQKTTAGTQLSEEQTKQIESLQKTLAGAGLSGSEQSDIVERVRAQFTTKTTTDLTENLAETEDVFRRPNLAYIFKLSPLAHLQKQWTPESVMLRYEGFRGARQRQGQPGEGVISARRVV